VVVEGFERFYNSALRFLSYRPRSKKEVEEKLLNKKAPQNIIDAVVGKLTEQKFLDDVEFAKWWIEQRTKVRPRAFKVIKFELKQKGISEETIDNLQLTIDDLENAKKLLSKKLERYKDMEKGERYQKLAQFLARRGFSWEVVKKSIDEVFSEGV